MTVSQAKLRFLLLLCLIVGSPSFAKPARDLLSYPIWVFNWCTLSAFKAESPSIVVSISTPNPEIVKIIARGTYRLFPVDSDMGIWIGNLYAMILSLPAETSFEDRATIFGRGLSAVRTLAWDRLRSRWSYLARFWPDGTVLYYGTTDSVVVFLRDGRILKGKIPEIWVDMGEPEQPLEYYGLQELVPRSKK